MKLITSVARALLLTFVALVSAVPAAANTVEYVHTDALGSVVAVTDANRAVTERREYEPYGYQLTPALQNGPGYTAHVQDAATGMTYMQQRYYDPQIGRFLSVDPVTTDGSTGGNFNRYWYANNNPYSNVDPDGRMCTSTNGTTTCSPDDGSFASFSVPTPEGWSDFHSNDLNFHRYRFEYDAGTGDAAYGAALEEELLKSPTNDNNPASQGGTLNDVGPLMTIGPVPLSGKDHVRSYTTSQGIANMTEADHAVGSGFVARRVEGKTDPDTGETRYTIITYGEGDSLKQLAPGAEGLARDFWNTNGRRIEERARRSE